MVTAGVYLIARMHGLYALAPEAQLWVGIIGAVTLLIAGCSALTQHDLKRVLAYSTISQIGYMFLALGIGAWSSAVFHFMIHAFFKALLFLGAGAVIMALHHEHDMFKMGGLRKQLPVIFWTFLIGAASLAALPLISAGFYSKDQILWLSFASDKSNVWFFLAAIGGAFITAMYTFRMVFITFYGDAKTHVTHTPGKLMTIPLIILAALALLGGFIELPHTLGHFTLFSDLFAAQLPEVSLRDGVESSEWIIQSTTGVLTLTGIYMAYHFYVKAPQVSEDIQRATADTHQFWYSGWRFDALYNALFVNPVLFLARINKHDFFDRFYGALVEISEMMNRIFSRSQSGILRWYIMGIVAGAVIIITFTILTTP
jgi:NADH-quinone oxidoreductase subunit L